MTSEDYRYITTLVLGVAGVQTAIMGLFIGLLYRALGKRLELIEGRLDKVAQRLIR